MLFPTSASKQRCPWVQGAPFPTWRLSQKTCCWSFTAGRFPTNPSLVNCSPARPGWALHFGDQGTLSVKALSLQRCQTLLVAASYAPMCLGMTPFRWAWWLRSDVEDTTYGRHVLHVWFHGFRPVKPMVHIIRDLVASCSYNSYFPAG